MVEDPPELDEPAVRAGIGLATAAAAGLVVAVLVVAGRLSLPPAVATYDDCAALRADFPAGVGARARDDLYRANRRLDPDRDGVACGTSRR